jgi:hypothetical protein
MSRKRFTVEHIVRILREAEVGLSQGESVRGSAAVLVSRNRATEKRWYHFWGQVTPVSTITLPVPAPRY